jgi:hypothetical protein
MFHRIHDRLGTAGVAIAVVALIAALGGTALAASGALTAKQKKEVKAIAKGLVGTGPAGAAGANGTNGANGAPGEKGAAGTNGTNGTNGNTVLSGSGAPSGGSPGDFYIKTGAEPEIYGPKTATWPGSGTKLKGSTGSQGPPGVIHPGETLPSGASETGAWATVMGKVQAEAPHASLGPIPISFNIPLPAAIPGANIKTKPVGFPTKNLTECEALPEPAEREACEATLKTEEEECPGTEAEPKAKAGFLCLYTALDKTGHTFILPATTTQAGVALFFAVFLAEHEGNAAFGTWAVTAE